MEDAANLLSNQNASIAFLLGRSTNAVGACLVTKLKSLLGRKRTVVISKIVQNSKFSENCILTGPEYFYKISNNNSSYCKVYVASIWLCKQKATKNCCKNSKKTEDLKVSRGLFGTIHLKIFLKEKTRLKDKCKCSSKLTSLFLRKLMHTTSTQPFGAFTIN